MNSNSDFKPEDLKAKLDYKYCEFCMAPIPRAQEIPYCTACQEKIIFHHVKEYIRANDVNELGIHNCYLSKHEIIGTAMLIVINL